MTPFPESNLSRVWHHFNDVDSCAAILTAFRHEFTPEQNTIRNQLLSTDLGGMRYGYVFISGRWIVTGGTPIEEVSIMVNGGNCDPIEFTNLIRDLGTKYGQGAVLIKTPLNTNLVFESGYCILVGNIQPGNLGTLYSRMRNGDTFVFDGEASPDSKFR